MSRRVGNHFVFRLIPPRPTFNVDMSAEERAIMDRHVEYWDAHTNAGAVVVYGPVVDATGPWGLGVITAENEEGARALVKADPAIATGLATAELGSMPVAVLPD